MVTLTSVQNPANASSTELSTTSYTKWCNPVSPVEPMYIAGLKRTASRPSSTLIEVESYTGGVISLLAMLPLKSSSSGSSGGIITTHMQSSNSHGHDYVTIVFRLVAARP